MASSHREHSRAGPSAIFDGRAYSVWDYVDGRDAEPALADMSTSDVREFFTALGHLLAKGTLGERTGREEIDRVAQRRRQVIERRGGVHVTDKGRRWLCPVGDTVDSCRQQRGQSEVRVAVGAGDTTLQPGTLLAA